jgi:hypothetical protein
MSDQPPIMSACERTIREVLEQIGTENDEQPLTMQTNAELVVISGGGTILRGLISDLDMWRKIVTNDIDKWSFDALITMAKRLLDEVYPETIFTGTSVESGMMARLIAHEIAQHVDVSDETLKAAHGAVSIEGVGEAADAVVKLTMQNSGVRFVLMMRALIAEIEARPMAHEKRNG